MTENEVKAVQESLAGARPPEADHLRPSEPSTGRPKSVHTCELDSEVDSEDGGRYCPICFKDIAPEDAAFVCDKCGGGLIHQDCEDSDTIDMVKLVCRKRGKVNIGRTGTRMMDEEYDLDCFQDPESAEKQWLCRECLPYAWEWTDSGSEGESSDDD